VFKRKRVAERLNVTAFTEDIADEKTPDDRPHDWRDQNFEYVEIISNHLHDCTIFFVHTICLIVQRSTGVSSVHQSERGNAFREAPA
jgi:hypothetical protein